MFSQVSVCPQRICVPIGGVYRHPQVLTSSGGYWSGRYATYWNAFLFRMYVAQSYVFLCLAYISIHCPQEISCNFVSHCVKLVLIAREIFQYVLRRHEDTSLCCGLVLDFWWCLPRVQMLQWTNCLHSSQHAGDRFHRFTSGATPAELLVASIAPETMRVKIQALSSVALTQNRRTASETKDISQRRIDLVEINQCLAHSVRLLSLLRENSSQGTDFLCCWSSRRPTFSWRYELRCSETDVLINRCLWSPRKLSKPSIEPM